jgi:hypothetical protein
VEVNLTELGTYLGRYLNCMNGTQSKHFGVEECRIRETTQVSTKSILGNIKINIYSKGLPPGPLELVTELQITL